MRRWRVFGGERATPPARSAPVPGEPTVAIISPRNGAVQTSHAVVVKVEVENFQLAPRHFGGEPQLGEGNIRFSLNRVPDCVDPEKLQTRDRKPDRQRTPGRRLLRLPAATRARTASSPKRIGTAGSYSPATRPEIFYHDLRPGFYRLIVTLAQNNGADRRPTTTSPTSRSSAAPATAANVHRRQGLQRQGRDGLE